MCVLARLFNFKKVERKPPLSFSAPKLSTPTKPNSSNENTLHNGLYPAVRANTAPSKESKRWESPGRKRSNGALFQQQPLSGATGTPVGSRGKQRWGVCGAVPVASRVV